MNLSEKAKQHADSCRFCWMCHHICPIGNATGHERSTARARALGISLVNRNAIALEGIMGNIYECATCGGCVNVCVTGWDPVLFTKEVRTQAALEDKLPSYIQKLAENALNTGNPYGKTLEDEALTNAINAHSEKTDTLLVLGADSRFMEPSEGVKAIRVLEKANVSFTVLRDEPSTGAELDFLIGKLNETKQQMEAFKAVADTYETVVFFDPKDAKCVKQLYAEYDLSVEAKAVTFTAFTAALVKEGNLSVRRQEKTVVFQDPFELSRDLLETEEARVILSEGTELHEFFLNRKETVFAGDILMAQYMPEVMVKVAERRIFNALSIHENVIVTAKTAEYHMLKAVPQHEVEILSLADVILA